MSICGGTGIRQTTPGTDEGVRNHLRLGLDRGKFQILAEDCRHAREAEASPLLLAVVWASRVSVEPA